jgi:sodium-dependent dicarboxylate transporter 2/3/5
MPKRTLEKSVVLFASILLLAAVLTWSLNDPSFSTQQTIVLFLTLLSIGLWITEATSPTAVALMVIAVLVFTLGYKGFTPSKEEVKVYTDTLSSGVIWLLLGGFFLADGMTKTGLSADLIAFSLRVCGKQPRWILFGMMTVTMVASMVMSNSTATVMVITALMPLILQVGKQSDVSKAMILGIPIAATTGGMATLIGSPTNLLAAAAAGASGESIDFLKWIVVGLPIALVLTGLGWWMLVKLLIKDAPPVAPLASAAKAGALTREAQLKRITVIIVLTTCAVTWLTSPLHGLSATAVAALPLVVLPLTGIITGTDIRAMGWDTLILIAGGLAMGEGLMRSGLMTHYAAGISSMNISPTVLMFSLAYVAMILSNVMSNTAACAILLPLGKLLLPEQVLEISVIVGLATSTSLLLPVSTPPNAIAYSTGVITQKDFRYGGLLVGLLGPLLVVLWTLLVV